MGVIRTVKGEDGRPYISIEDIIKEVEFAKRHKDLNKDSIPEDTDFIDIVLTTLRNMETEYYEKFLFKKN